MANARSWPFDDEDRPSGSVRPVSQADLQAILAHLNTGSDELLAGTGADRPVVAVRGRASVGRPGGSARSTGRRVGAGGRGGGATGEPRPGPLPCGLPPPLSMGAGGGVLGSLLAPRLGLVLGGLA